MVVLKSDKELDIMKDAGKIVAETHALLKENIKPGITTLELDHIAEKNIKKNGAEPSFKGYRGFPASICASINEQVVHGIPGIKRIENGDIISIDIGAYYKGYHGDAAKTYPVGDVDEELIRLIKITEESLHKGIEKALVGNRLSDISNAVQIHAEENGFSVVKNFVGHGIGSEMHEEPQVPNFGPPGRGPRLKQGMALAIEPMVNMGTWEVKTLEDEWTVVTKDHKPSAHFEHSIAITEDGPIILTVGEEGG
ncbi:type I methionyl aminopeptidase [Natranaerofaba carboxydovora]|uniref:type I methionyl aminopeptidase n=1 Tax=Natranaerofaba carboxydovora TaxID=2742683 RepID=UPI001F1405DF|nr:type I methionyl aminopeptidase [Natranaerofaba carboxydovora]UMZ75415.1 Methionine aminopeptidase 1 [Natranaerofaba carboxydovora]